MGRGTREPASGARSVEIAIWVNLVIQPCHPQTHLPETKRRSTMAATLKLTHKAIGVEVRRGTYDIVVDGQRA